MWLQAVNVIGAFCRSSAGVGDFKAVFSQSLAVQYTDERLISARFNSTFQLKCQISLKL